MLRTESGKWGFCAFFIVGVDKIDGNDVGRLLFEVGFFPFSRTVGRELTTSTTGFRRIF